MNSTDKEPKRWPRPRKLKIEGLGDIVEIAAKPIAVAIDMVFNTNLTGCGSCQQRKNKLNELFPIKKDDANE